MMSESVGGHTANAHNARTPTSVWYVCVAYVCYTIHELMHKCIVLSVCMFQYA